MASSEVDQKFLGQFAKNIANDNVLLSSMLFKILGLSVILSKQLVRAQKLRKLDTTRATKSLDLYFHILWLSREGLVIVEQYVLPMVTNFRELKVLAYKLRASFYHIFVLFHNQPPVNQIATQKIITTPPGLASPRPKKPDKGKGRAPESPPPESGRNSVQPPHPMEGGPVGGVSPPEIEVKPAASFLLPARDYIPTALACFQEASDLAERFLWGSHPLRLSVKLEFSAFLYDCMHDGDGSRRLARATIAEVYNAQEGMDDDTFEDAAELVNILGRMMKRGLGSRTPSSTPGMASSGSKSTPGRSGGSASRPAVPSPGMDNPI
jgi:14-3-3 protein